MNKEEFSVKMDFFRRFCEENFGYVPQNMKNGDNSIAFSCGQDVIRIPLQQTEGAIANYKKEAYVTKYLKERCLDLPISVVSLCETGGVIYSRHKKIEGKIIGKPRNANDGGDNFRCEDFSYKERQCLAVDLGKFLARLHSVSFDGIDRGEVPTKFGIPEEKDASFLERTKELCATYGIEYLPEKCHQEDFVLAHNDFHGGNIALDESKRLVGVFDFGECCINYRSNDFLKMYQAMGRDFAVAMVESYNRHSKVKVNQEVLDVHYLSLISLFKDCAEKPEYKDRADGLKKYVKECLERYKKDKLLMAKIKFAKGACLE